MTTAWKDNLAEVRDELLHPFDPLVHPRYLKGGILVSQQEEGGLCHSGSTVGREELPVAVDVAIPVQATVKSGALKLDCIEVDIRFGYPGWQGRRVASRIERARLWIGHDGMPAFGRRGVA